MAVAFREEGDLDGVFHLWFIDTIPSSDMKEDAPNVLSSLSAALPIIIAELGIYEYALEVDGAGCYAGAEFLANVPNLFTRCGAKLTSVSTGEGGTNKSHLDGHFGGTGSALRRHVAADKGDIIGSKTLAVAIAAASPNTTVILYNTDRAKFIGAPQGAMLNGISRMSTVTYQYGSDGMDEDGEPWPELESMTMYQHTGFGTGKVVMALDLQGSLVAEGDTGASVAWSNYDAASDDSVGAPTGRTSTGKENDQEAKAGRGKARMSRKEAKAKAIDTRRAARMARSTRLLCRNADGGHPQCTRSFTTPQRLANHITSGEHCYGDVMSHRHTTDRSASAQGVSKQDFMSRSYANQQTMNMSMSASSSASSSSSAPADKVRIVAPSVEEGWRAPASVSGSAHHRDRSARDHVLPKLSKEVLTLIHAMYTSGASNASKKFDPTSASEYLQGYGTAAHAKTYSHFVGSGNMVVPTPTDDGQPMFRLVELPTRKQIKGYFGASGDLAKQAEKAPTLAALRALPALYPSKQDDKKCYWTIQYDDGDVQGSNGRELDRDLRLHDGAAGDPFAPSGRGDILRRVTTDFEGVRFSGSVVDFTNGETQPPKKKSKASSSAGGGGGGGGGSSSASAGTDKTAPKKPAGRPPKNKRGPKSRKK